MSSRKFGRVGFVSAMVAAVFGGSLVYRELRPSDSGARLCAEYGSACLEYMTISAGFDALPLEIQASVHRYADDAGEPLQRNPPVANDHEFFFIGNGQIYIQLTGHNPPPGNFRLAYYADVQTKLKKYEGFELTDLNQRLRSAKPGYRGSSACDLQNPSRLLGLSETKVRRCLRAFYLSVYAPEFNERTRKLFGEVKIQYGDGTTGPVSFLRPKLTDADLDKMVSAMERFDTKARSLGGFR